MLRKVPETQTDTAAWAASSAGISTDILRNGAITEIVASVEVTPSATLTAANAPDGLWRVIQNLSIQGGSQTYLTLPSQAPPVGGTLLHYLNRYDGFGVGQPDGAIAAPTHTYTPIHFVFHMGTRPRGFFNRRNPYDLTAFIPSTLDNRLRAVWVTAGNTVMDDTVTISSAVMRFSLAFL